MTNLEEIHQEPEKWPGPQKLKLKRDYSRGSLRAHIGRAETLEDLQEIGQFIQTLDDAKKLSAKTRRKLADAFRAKYAKLNTQLIARPTRAKLLVPAHMARGRLIVRPGEE